MTSRECFGNGISSVFPNCPESLSTEIEGYTLMKKSVRKIESNIEYKKNNENNNKYNNENNNKPDPAVSTSCSSTHLHARIDQHAVGNHCV